MGIGFRPVYLPCVTQAFDAPSAKLELCDLYLSHSRSCVMLSFIITLEIVNWLGAVIAQSGRQFDENGIAFSWSICYNLEKFNNHS